jgi:DDE superfamily endonuclease
VWRLLGFVGWSRQRLTRRASKRDDAAVDPWVKVTWAAQKGARRSERWIVFEDENGFSLTPPLRQTWAAPGRTPVVRHRFNWNRVSAASALCYRWDGRRAPVLSPPTGAYNDVAVVGFLEQLRCRFRGERVLLLWDGLMSHRSRTMNAYLKTH